MRDRKPDDSYPAHWANCLSQLQKLGKTDIRQLLASDPGRIKAWAFEAAGLKIDLSRTPLEPHSLSILKGFAQSLGLESAISKLFSGEKINTSENRAAHHTALRSFLEAGAHPHEQAAARAFAKISTISNGIRNGDWPGSSGKSISDVINIGIGGSDLGSRMVCSAFEQQTDGPRIHFAANVDPVEMDSILQTCEAESTLVIISSKSFNTLETLENAKVAKQWLQSNLGGSQLQQHLVAVTANTEAAQQFGVEEDNILPMWDWIGGRYSLWSSAGLPIAIALGMDNFEQFLRGALAMDKHFANTPLEQNAPVLLALLEMLYVNLWGVNSVAVLPYSQELHRLPDYLQQLCMESNGKSVQQNGLPVEAATCPVIWGSAGTIGQHSFHQLLHQGTSVIPVDFILPLHSHSHDSTRQAYLVANCLAQSQAFINGKSVSEAVAELTGQGVAKEDAEALAPHKMVPGNRPSTLVAMDKLTPATLGALIALYEHKVFVQSVLWNINAFDQWGVELGKQLCEPIFQGLSGNDAANEKGNPTDPTTRYWIDQYRKDS